jgi:hypothetical protein
VPKEDGTVTRQLRYPRKVLTRLTDEQFNALEAASLATKAPTADIIRDAIDFYLAATPPPKGLGGKK